MSQLYAEKICSLKSEKVIETGKEHAQVVVYYLALKCSPSVSTIGAILSSNFLKRFTTFRILSSILYASTTVAAAVCTLFSNLEYEQVLNLELRKICGPERQHEYCIIVWIQYSSYQKKFKENLSWSTVTTSQHRQPQLVEYVSNNFLFVHEI